MGSDLKEILCIQWVHAARDDNCVTYRGQTHQIRAQKHGRHFVTTKVRVHGYPDRSLAIFMARAPNWTVHVLQNRTDLFSTRPRGAGREAQIAWPMWMR